MNRSRFFTLGIVLLIVGLSVILGTTENAQASRIIDSFIRVGSGEFLTVPFTSPSFSTENSYEKLVEIIVYGTGYSAATAINDAFYGIPSGVPYDPQYYQLNIGWDGFDLFSRAGESHNVNNFITFIEGVGSVKQGTTPAYNGTNHTYDFVISIPKSSGILDFGVSDGIFSDNGGEYNIQIFQLQPMTPESTATPEPASIFLLGSGILSMSAFGRKLRKHKA